MKKTNHECAGRGHRERPYLILSPQEKKKITNVWILFKKTKQHKTKQKGLCPWVVHLGAYLLSVYFNDGNPHPGRRGALMSAPSTPPAAAASRGSLACTCLITDTSPVMCYSSLSDNLSLSPLTCHSSADGFDSDAKSDTGMRGSSNLNWNNGSRVANFTPT